MCWSLMEVKVIHKGKTPLPEGDTSGCFSIFSFERKENHKRDDCNPTGIDQGLLRIERVKTEW